MESKIIDNSKIKQKECKNNSTKISSPYLTKYEITNIIGLRAIKLSKGEKPLVTIDEINPVKIATEELKQGLLKNIIIERFFPNGENELWDISEMKI